MNIYLIYLLSYNIVLNYRIGRTIATDVLQAEHLSLEVVLRMNPGFAVEHRLGNGSVNIIPSKDGQLRTLTKRRRNAVLRILPQHSVGQLNINENF
jgi:hypothetical protein